VPVRQRIVVEARRKAHADPRGQAYAGRITASGLLLKHDHRQADGTEDVRTMYGGDSVASRSATRQQFPVDADSRALFAREGLQASLGNTWAIEIVPGRLTDKGPAAAGPLGSTRLAQSHSGGRLASGWL
jgi:hypothetical protein